MGSATVNTKAEGRRGPGHSLLRTADADAGVGDSRVENYIDPPPSPANHERNGPRPVHRNGLWREERRHCPHTVSVPGHLGGASQGRHTPRGQIHAAHEVIAGVRLGGGSGKWCGVGVTRVSVFGARGRALARVHVNTLTTRATAPAESTATPAGK